MKILSLFDGMACGALAMQAAREGKTVSAFIFDKTGVMK